MSEGRLFLLSYTGIGKKKRKSYMLHNRATKEPTASDTFLDTTSWDDRFLGRRDKWYTIAVSRVSGDIILRSSSMGSILSSTVGSPAPGFSKPTALVSKLVSFGEGQVISSTASSWERAVQRHGGGANVVKVSRRDQALSNSSKVAQQQSATCWKGSQRPTKSDCHVSPWTRD